MILNLLNKYIIIGIASALLTGGAAFGVHLFAKHHYNKGVAQEKADQAERDKLIKPVQEELKQAIEGSKDAQDETTEKVRTEVHTGITAAYLERATKDAMQNGKEMGRAIALEQYRAKGGCLTEHYDPDDGLLNIGRDQQLSIFGNVIGDSEASQTSKVRETGETEQVSSSRGDTP